MNTTTLQQYNLLINGQLKPSGSDSYFESVNPSNNELVGLIADATTEDMDIAITAAKRAINDIEGWKTYTAAERGIYLKKIAEAIRKNAKELADLESMDTGKPIKHTTFIDVPTCADTFDYFSNVEGLLKEETNKVEAPVDSKIVYEPIGVVGSIIPWNYPLINFAWKLAPALAAGNTVILKPSPVACLAIMRLAQLINEIGLPEGVVNIVTSTSNEVSAHMVESEDVNMISFTGSSTTGQSIMQSAAQQTKKIVLELGGKSPNIVFADCDIETAVGGAMGAIFLNQGQMCTAGSRLFVEADIYDEFVGKLVEQTKTIKMGMASDNETTFGPLVSTAHREKVLNDIKAGVSEEAEILCGGKIPEGEAFKNGAFIEPTILGNVTNDMQVAQEEIFGPVLCVIKFQNNKELVEWANDTKYGLAACIWTKDEEKAKDIADQLQCGTVWINTYGAFFNSVPFGGYKQSGFGRELGRDGLLAYTQSKHICIDKTPGGQPLVAGWF